MATRAPRKDDLPDDALIAAQDVCIETAGRLAEFWGFTRTMGRVYCALFLSQRGLAQPEIVERLGVSAANVSMSLKGLMRWGAVHKVYEKGTRKALYEAEPEFRKIIRNVVGGREQRELKDAEGRLKEALAILRSAAPTGGEAELEHEFVAERVVHLDNVVRLSNRLIDMLLGQGRVDVKAELGESDWP